MTIPTIHLNGSGKRNLIDGLINARSAIEKAKEALAQTAPHGRDYYVQVDGDMNLLRANTEHRSRWNKLQSVQDELDTIIDGIYAQDKTT